jgi:cytochrome c-type protein NapC
MFTRNTKESVHYKNASGVRATCADCHVPKEWTPKLIRKIQASNEIYHKVIGSLDTREKLVDKRMQMTTTRCTGKSRIARPG